MAGRAERVDSPFLSWERELRGGPRLAELRRQVGRVFAGRVPDARRDDLLLVLTELVTNAYLHTGAPISVYVSVQDDGALIEVRDHGDGVLRLRPPSTTRIGGRGLYLVEVLSADWGVVFADAAGGKTVWAALRWDGV